jgi:hypothetical protein
MIKVKDMARRIWQDERREDGAMDWKRKKTPLMGLVGGIGVAVFLLGAVGGLYSIGLSIALAFTVWIVGATLVNVLVS